MSSFTMRVPKSLIAKAKEKAGYIPLSVIFRQLIERWISGEIEFDSTKKG